MILRNITKHVSDQNWFAVLIDFLIVVVGVIIGDSIERSQFRNDLTELAANRELDNQIAFRYGIAGSTIYALAGLQLETENLLTVLRQGTDNQ